MKRLFTLLMLFFTGSALASEAEIKQAYADAKAGKAVFIDIREKFEIEAGMIDIAKWFPMSRIGSGSDWLEDFKAMTEGKEIYLYCRSGNRAGRLKSMLEKAGIKSHNYGGYTNIKNILERK